MRVSALQEIEIDWVSAVDDILTGPASQHLTEQAWEEQRELTGRNTMDTW